MSTIEFDAEVRNGRIELPLALRDKVRGAVHVVVYQQLRKEGESLIQELLRNPLKVPEFEPLTRADVYTRK